MTPPCPTCLYSVHPHPAPLRYYGVWMTIYYYVVFCVRSKRITERKYETLFVFIMDAANKHPARRVLLSMTSQPWLQRILYLGMHLALGLVTMAATPRKVALPRRLTALLKSSAHSAVAVHAPAHGVPRHHAGLRVLERKQRLPQDAQQSTCCCPHQGAVTPLLFTYGGAWLQGVSPPHGHPSRPPSQPGATQGA